MHTLKRTDGPAIIAMVHLGALPGTPGNRVPLPEIAHSACEEARVFCAAGVDGLIIENMHDVPYLNGAVGPEIVAAMAVAGAAVRAAAGSCPLGVQILAGANQEALAVAHAIGAEFVRVENFIFAHVADEGLMPSAAAGPLLRYRRQIGAQNVQIWADIRKKHASHAITSDIAVDAAAGAAEFCGADAVIVTGEATGKPAEISDLRQARQAVKIPIIVGSGVTPDNVAPLWNLADALIVGSALKFDGRWSNPVDAQRVARFMSVVRSLREQRP